jgi:NADH pyrophosphatase NudC (nudix superfamily)
MIIAITCVIAIVVIVFVLGVRPRDLPEPEPVSPFQHLDERKAAIYENLRDLQFEYRVGKLSDADYQQTKKDLQKELASVMAEVDRLKEELRAGQPAPAAPPVAALRSRPKQETDPRTCPHCSARFDKELKFCGECGKPMKAVRV